MTIAEGFMKSLVALIDNRIANAGALAPSTPTPAPAADPFGGLTAGTSAPVTAPIEVTPMMIQQLIMPLLANEGAKARLTAAMQAQGISELPAAKPDQLAGLYAAFKAIADEIGGAAPAVSGGVNLI